MLLFINKTKIFFITVFFNISVNSNKDYNIWRVLYMAVKKTKKDEKKSKITSKTDDTKMGRISYKELSEELKLKLKQSEEKIAELNQKYKKVVDIQKKKIEDKYKKIIEDLESKKSIPAKTSSASNNAEINKLQKR